MRNLPPKFLAAMIAVRALPDSPLYEGDNKKIIKEALTDLDYIRVESYVFAHVGGSGIIEGCAGPLLRRRKEIKSEHIKVFADVKKKHSAHALTADLDITDEIMQAEFFLVDGVIVTSQFTGIEPKEDDLKKAKSITKLPVIIG